ncbi:MAG: S26 family signal peptidase, partial [Sphingomonas sp.]|nr:S26 family signal peptidase [Sphingomonas sp.]
FLGLLTGSIQAPPRPRLLWNASASAPTGLYRIHPNAALRTGDTVAASTPNTVRALADRRGYLPANVPLVKRVAAGRGSLVCAISLPCQEAGAPPVGLTLAGAGGTDDHLLDVAGAVEAILQRRR